ncbi:MAG: hypothetical protein FWH18_01465 [Marinilabiliaceae bacterium]|nr:hypothetical protein [Marinilabiliaceae bacterium]
MRNLKICNFTINITLFFYRSVVIIKIFFNDFADCHVWDINGLNGFKVFWGGKYYITFGQVPVIN